MKLPRYSLIDPVCIQTFINSDDDSDDDNDDDAVKTVTSCN